MNNFDRHTCWKFSKNLTANSFVKSTECVTEYNYLKNFKYHSLKSLFFPKLIIETSGNGIMFIKNIYIYDMEPWHI